MTHETPSTKPSANSMVRCPPIPKLDISDFEKAIKALAFMFGFYGDCAIPHNGLVDYEEKVNK